MAGEPRNGISVFGDLKYGPDFTHFDYVNPNAPKGGTIKFSDYRTFDNLNPYILRGVPAQGTELVVDTLMTRAMDEPDAVYALIAKSVELADDRSWIAFNLDPRARFHDGTPITAQDVTFTFHTLVEKGHPQFRILYDGVASVRAEGDHRVVFTFKPGRHRDLPVNLAGLPVLSKAYYDKVDFAKTTVDPPLGNGPYRIASVDVGRNIVYRRVPDYWARDLPVNRGRYNFDEIRWEYFRDREVAFAAFFSGAYDFREEFTSRDWATQYDNKTPVKQKLIVRDTLPDKTPSGVQAFFYNMRRARFQDRRVREALDLAFDFEWTNKTLFYGLYDRTNSMFENSSLAAHDKPTAGELALLEPFRGRVPDEVFTTPYASPKTDGSGNNRRNLRKAAQLLRAAGWSVKGGVLVDPKGEPFVIEFLMYESSFERVIAPYIRNLARLGIKAKMRLVDPANYVRRRQDFDFDATVARYVQALTPGIELRNYFESANADMTGSLNLAGIKDPVVDALVEKAIAAGSRPALVDAVHALDRVVMWNHYTVPQWYKGVHNIAYWNRFARPKVQPSFDLGVVDTWWVDKRKDAMISAGTAPPGP